MITFTGIEYRTLSYLMTFHERESS